VARKRRIKCRKSPQLTVHSRQLEEEEERERFNAEDTEGKYTEEKRKRNAAQRTVVGQFEFPTYCVTNQEIQTCPLPYELRRGGEFGGLTGAA
jgi:hypothetical protein